MVYIFYVVVFFLAFMHQRFTVSHVSLIIIRPQGIEPLEISLPFRLRFRKIYF